MKQIPMMVIMLLGSASVSSIPKKFAQQSTSSGILKKSDLETKPFKQTNELYCLWKIIIVDAVAFLPKNLHFV